MAGTSATATSTKSLDSRVTSEPTPVSQSPLARETCYAVSPTTKGYRCTQAHATPRYRKRRIAFAWTAVCPTSRHPRTDDARAVLQLDVGAGEICYKRNMPTPPVFGACGGSCFRGGFNQNSAVCSARPFAACAAFSILIGPSPGWWRRTVGLTCPHQPLQRMGRTSRDTAEAELDEDKRRNDNGQD